MSDGTIQCHDSRAPTLTGIAKAMSRMRHDDLRELAVEIDLVRRSRDGETRDRSSSAVTAETLSAVAEILGMDAKP